jgi:hypothetical protein
MITFHGMKTYPSRMILVFVCFLVLQGCTECNDDTCGYNSKTIGLWSDDNSKLAGIFIDYGDDKSTGDNTYSIFTLNPDGSDFDLLYELESKQVLENYSSIQNYMILTTPHPSGLESRRYTKLDLESLNTEILATNDQPCLDRKILPSLDGSVLAVVEVTGQEDGYLDDKDGISGCKNLSMTVDFIN